MQVIAKFSGTNRAFQVYLRYLQELDRCCPNCGRRMTLVDKRGKCKLLCPGRNSATEFCGYSEVVR